MPRYNTQDLEETDHDYLANYEIQAREFQEWTQSVRGTMFVLDPAIVQKFIEFLSYCKRRNPEYPEEFVLQIFLYKRFLQDKIDSNQANIQESS